jgi:hypothetical protein
MARRLVSEFRELRPHVRMLWYFVVFQAFFLAVEVFVLVTH